MPVHYDIHNRLEPRPSHKSDLTRGFTAETADPAWFLGRQWQMGEHQGENAASPVLALVTYGRRPLLPAAGRPGQFPGHRLPADSAIDADPDHPVDPDDPGEPGDPADLAGVRAIVPAEAIIEGETEDWWTPGRRIRIGLAAKADLDEMDMTEKERAGLCLPVLPEPYAEFSGGYDGLMLHQARLKGGFAELDATIFEGVPEQTRKDHWLPSELKYGQVDFPCDTDVPETVTDVPRLTVRDHDGGEVEWWSADAAGDWSVPIPDNLKRIGLEIQPVRFSYPGAPHPRWWQIEDAQTDIGGFPPDRSHFASMLLLDLVLAHSDDWFTLPLEAQIGDMVTIEDLVVIDLFGDKYSWETHPALKPPEDWSLFRIRGIENGSIVVWPSVAVPVAGEAFEEVALGMDEDANVMWAVEERANGLRLTNVDIDPPDPPALESETEPGAPPSRAYIYRPATYVPHHWHPYLIRDAGNRRTFVQGRMMDFTSADPGSTGQLSPEPVARLLYDPDRGDNDPMHRIEPAAVPTTGLRLERRYILARRSDGSPELWVQRQHRPLISPPVSGLRFDVMLQ